MKKLTANLLLLTTSILISSGVSAEGSMQHFGESAQHLKQSTVHTAGSIGNGLVDSNGVKEF